MHRARPPRMMFALLPFFVLTGAAPSFGQQKPPAAPTNQPKPPPDTGKLSADFLKSAEVLVPSPSELMAGLKDANITQWGEAAKLVETGAGSLRLNKADKPTKALNLGVRFADCFVAIQAKDKNTFLEAVVVAKSLAEQLGVGAALAESGKEVEKLVRAGDWPGTLEQLDLLRDDALRTMQSTDQDSATLATAAGWVRGLHLVTSVLNAHYSEQSSRILRQPDLAAHLKSAVAKLSPATKEHPKVKELEAKLGELEKLLAVDKGAAVSKEGVSKIFQVTAALVKSIQS
jgi:hypothetical protein